MQPLGIDTGDAGYHPVDVERVMRTATSLFATLGYEGAGTRQIAEISGCRVPSLYYHFQSKEGLYRATFDDKCEGVVEAVTLAITCAADPRSRLRAYVDTLFDQFTIDRELLLLLQRDLVNATAAPTRYLFGSGHARLASILEGLIQPFSGTPPGSHTIYAVMSLIFGYCCGLQLAGGNDADRARDRERLFECVLKLIGHTAPA